MDESDFCAYTVGVAYASVCTSLPIEEATRRLNAEHPTGIDHGWSLSDDATFADGIHPNPCPCHLKPDTHTHYLFSC
jgi:hypothetical protein